MAKAEGLRIPFVGTEHIATQILEVFPYEGPRQRIVCTTDEFSAVCPYSGLPDIATIVLEYIPAKVAVELKSLKYYYVSFRSVGIYQEDATSRIYQDLVTLLKPDFLKVTVTYQTRGGIDTTTSISTDEQNPVRR